MFYMSLDERSMSEITMFYSWNVMLQPEVQQAMKDIGDMLTAKAQQNTWEVFENPSGDLAGTIHPVASQSEVMVEVDSPYGRRRELGFSGMTDSIGRYYPYDPGKPYLGPALENNAQEAFMMLEQAVERTFARMGAVT